jgi:hypothetical protein
MYNNLINRLKYLAQNIKATVRNVISSSAITNIYGSGLESSCCSEDAESFNNYYYLIELESNYPLKNVIDESKEIFTYTNYFTNIGSIHKFLLLDKSKYDGIYNLYDHSIFKLDNSDFDLNKIFFFNYKNSPIDIVVDENKTILNETYSHIPLNHFILPITEYQYSIYNNQINLKMIVEITNNNTPFDFYFISTNNILSHSYLQEEFETFLNILF